MNAEPRSITIVGFGDSARNLQKAGTLRSHFVGEVWTMNNAWDCFGADFKADRWFAMHTHDAIERTYRDERNRWCPWTMLDNCGCDVYMQTPSDRVRRARQYPLAEVYGYFANNFFYGTPSQMLALALYEGVNHVCTHGIDMQDARHLQQKVSWAWWVHEGMQRGVTFSGTALAFMYEQDVDEGLRGLRERIGDELEKKIQQKEKPS